MSTTNKPFSFLQISDILLDDRFSFKDMHIPAEKRKQRNEEALEALLGLCRLALDRKADAITIVGNLWDGQSVTAQTVARLIDAFAQLGDLPVLINPGLKDPLDAPSFYNPHVVAAFGLRPWSKNVRILPEAVQGGWNLPHRPDVCFVTAAGQAKLKGSTLSNNGTCLIGLSSVQTRKQMVEIASNKKVTYTAFGGIANFTMVSDTTGGLRGAVAGSFIGRSLNESGERCALWIEIAPKIGGDGYQATFEQIPCDRRSICALTVKINGIKAHNVSEHLKKTVIASGINESNILHLIVSGTYSPGNMPEFAYDELDRLCFHTVLDDRTRPDYHLDKVDQRASEVRFSQLLQDLKATVETRGGSIPGTEYGVELTASVVEDALYFGLEALKQKKVTVPNED